MCIRDSFDIDMPDTQFIFGYAVDASWVPPTTKPVTDPDVDFPPEANCFEPYKITTSVYPYDGPYGMTDLGGYEVIYASVYDYQGESSHQAPVIECPELFDGASTMLYNGFGPGYSDWRLVIKNANYAPAGTYKLLIKVTDNENATAPEWLDLSAYYVREVTVIEHPHGWARTWGGTSADEGSAVAVDEDNNIYVTGCFYDTVDFDPGPDTDIHTSNGISDIFVSKFNPLGDHLWTKTWGGASLDQGMGIVVDFDGYVYVTGFFRADTDFDPGVGTDIHEGSGAFLSKLDTDGNFIWAKTWGKTTGPSSDVGLDVRLNMSAVQVFVVGYFDGTVDFDPGSGTTNLVSNGSTDVFITCFTYEGGFCWARGWGGTEGDTGFAVNTYPYPDLYVVGFFSGSVDFDPGAGSDIQSGVNDAFLSKFNQDGDYAWTKVWGGTGYDFACGVETSGSYIYVAGSFEETVDFDPGTGIHNKTSAGASDAYLSFFYHDGSFASVKTWGSIGEDFARDVSTSGDFIVYVTGWFEDTVDFDPGAGSATVISAGLNDVFLSKFVSDDFEWVRTWGGIGQDRGISACWDWLGMTYVTGFFADTVDFNPGPDVDDHISNGVLDVFLSKIPYNGYW